MPSLSEIWIIRKCVAVLTLIWTPWVGMCVQETLGDPVMLWLWSVHAGARNVMIVQPRLFPVLIGTPKQRM